MTRVVLDSNIYISALIFGGIPRVILGVAEVGGFWLAVSDPLKAEVERVLPDKFGWSEEQVASACQPIWNIAHSVLPKTKVTAAGDPDDNRILECALEAGADFLVTGDRDLLDLKEFQDIHILTPREFLDSRAWKR